MRYAARTVFAALFAWGTLAGAQADTGAWHRRCREAERAYAAGQRVAELSSCEAARVVAQQLRTETRSTNTDSLLRVMRYAAEFTDATVFRTFLAIVADTSATPEARVMSIVQVNNFLLGPNTNWRRYEQVTQPANPDGSLPCLGVHSWVSERTEKVFDGEALPADATAQWRALMARLVRDSSTVTLVRHAAQCAEGY
jgi:hypothetical protein